tara:strand:- start:29 stop:1123 length:1095 start_codon:yes stop_codon:yes gene_type:complete
MAALKVHYNSFCRRRTYFISGFDPRGVAHYQGLFKRALKQRGWRLGRRLPGDQITLWPLEMQGTELAFLHWDDVARAHWPKHPFSLLRQLLPFGWDYVFKGRGWAYAGLFPGVALCGLYPLVVLAVTFLLAAAASWFGLQAGPQLGLMLAVVLPVLVFWRGWLLAEQLGVVWLSRSILFTYRLGEARDQSLRLRVQMLAESLLDLEHNSPAEEILIAGHSSGSFVLAMLAAELRRRPEAEPLLQKMSLLSLGQNLANLALFPRANSFRQDLKDLAKAPRLPWLDVTSVDDLLCFAGVNPYKACGMVVPEQGEYPRLQLLDLRKARGLKRRRQWLSVLFELHFDYLCDPSSGIDLCGLIAGEGDC